MMDQISASPGPSLALVTPGHKGGPFVVALARALTDLGVRNTIHADGDPDILAADGIILTGYFPRLRKTKAILRTKAPMARPPVMAWICEPLVPDDIAGWAMRLAKKLSSPSEGTKGGLWLRLTRPAFQPIALFGMGRWKASSTAKELQFAFGYTIWLRRGLDEGWIDTAATSTIQKGQIIDDWGHQRLFAPLSFEMRDNIPQPPAEERDLDVLFLGRLDNPWRRARMHSIVRGLRRAGLNVMVVSHGLRGAEREAVLARTRLILHLTKYRWDTAWMRFYLGAAHGIAVASEPLSVPEPLRPGIDYLEARPEDLSAAIVALLGDEPKRASMVAASRSQIIAEMDFKDGVHRMVDALVALRSSAAGRKNDHAG